MRLTNEMRDAVVRRLIERTRAPRDARLRNHEHALTVRLIRHRFGDDVFERCRALPEGWLHSHKVIHLDNAVAQRLTPCKAHLRYPGRGRNLPMREVRRLYTLSLDEYAPLPASASLQWSAELLDPFFDEIEQFARDLRSHEDEVERLRVQTSGILSTYTTAELLSRDWPDGYALLPPEMLAPPVPPGVPAVRIADLGECIERIRTAA